MYIQYYYRCWLRSWHVICRDRRALPLEFGVQRSQDQLPQPLMPGARTRTRCTAPGCARAPCLAPNARPRPSAATGRLPRVTLPTARFVSAPQIAWTPCHIARFCSAPTTHRATPSETSGPSTPLRRCRPSPPSWAGAPPSPPLPSATRP